MDKGSYTYSDGTTYEGGFKDGMRHGHGVWTRPDGSIYAGEWENDKPSGHGTFTLPDGKQHVGEWRDGKRHGPGVEIQPDGRRVYGLWKEGRLEEEREQAVANSRNGHEFAKKKERQRRANKKTPIIVSLLLVVALLAVGATLFIMTIEDETFSVSGRVVNYEGEGIAGVTIDFDEEFGATQTDEKGYWSKSNLQGKVTITPHYGNVLFNPIRTETSKAEDEVNFTLLKEVDKGITSSTGEYIFSSHLTTAEDVELTVIVEDYGTGEKLEGIDVEVVIGGDTIEIFLQDDEGLYLPAIIVLEMERLEEYPGVKVRSGSLLVSIGTKLLSNKYLQWALQNPREASAVTALSIAVGLDVYGAISYTAGGIAIMTAPATAGASVLPGTGAILAGFAMTTVSAVLKVYAENVYKGIKKTEHPVTIFIYESHESTAHAKLLVPAGTSIDEIIREVESNVGSREYEIIAPGINPAGAYYNDDGTPKLFYVYLKSPRQEHKAEIEPVDFMEEFYIVNVDADSNLFIRKNPGTKNKPGDDIISRVPRGRLLEVMNKHDNTVVIDNFTWWEVKDLLSGLLGWVASEYLEVSIKAKMDIKEPYSGHEFGLESIGISSGMTLEEVIRILGKPITEEEIFDDGRYSDGITIGYSGLQLNFYENRLEFYEITTPDIISKRGIRVGDTAESVINKYLEEEHKEIMCCGNLFKCVELYYIDMGDGTAKGGGYHRDHQTGKISSIHYWFGVPESCAGIFVTYFIENGLVKSIILYS